MFLDFKKWGKSIQTAGYNGARTVVKAKIDIFLTLIMFLYKSQRCTYRVQPLWSAPNN